MKARLNTGIAMKNYLLVSLLTLATSAVAQDAPNVLRGVPSVEVTLDSEVCVIERTDTQIHPSYARTGQGLPQPISLAPGVETLGELEFIDYMVRAGADDSILVIDTRTENWHADLRIPCTTNVSYRYFADDRDEAIFYLTELFDVIELDNGELDFSQAKTLVGYCNGYWCGQTPAMFSKATNSLLKMGYPPSKLKYYRGGMQAWTSLGLSVEGQLAR